MSDIIIEKVNSSFVQVLATADILHELNSYFAVYVDGYIFNPRFKAKIWDGKVRFFSMNTGLLPTGLVKTLQDFARKNKYSVEFSGFEDFGSEYDEDKFKVIISEALQKSRIANERLSRRGLQTGFAKENWCIAMLYIIWQIDDNLWHDQEYADIQENKEDCIDRTKHYSC